MHFPPTPYHSPLLAPPPPPHVLSLPVEMSGLANDIVETQHTTPHHSCHTPHPPLFLRNNVALNFVPHLKVPDADKEEAGMPYHKLLYSKVPEVYEPGAELAANPLDPHRVEVQ